MHEVLQPETEPHIAVLKLRATKLATRLGCSGQHGAARHVEAAIEAGDREALEALLREENAS